MHLCVAAESVLVETRALLGEIAMRQIVNNHLRGKPDGSDGLSTNLPIERIVEQKETIQDSQSSSCPTMHAPYPAGKRKRRCISFVALALVLLFASLCILSLFKLQPVALGHNMLALDNNSILV